MNLCRHCKHAARRKNNGKASYFRKFFFFCSIGKSKNKIIGFEDAACDFFIAKGEQK